METPSVADVQLRSPLLAEYEDPDRLQVVLDDDAPVVSELTGRAIGPPGTPGEEVPDYLRPVAIRALALRAERFLVTGTAEKRTGAIGALALRSFTAGPYSETYFGPGEAASAKTLDPDPAVHELLWALATPEKRAYWLALWGVQEPPAFAQVESLGFGMPVSPAYPRRWRW